MQEAGWDFCSHPLDFLSPVEDEWLRSCVIKAWSFTQRWRPVKASALLSWPRRPTLLEPRSWGLWLFFPFSSPLTLLGPVQPAGLGLDVSSLGECFLPALPALPPSSSVLLPEACGIIAILFFNSHHPNAWGQGTRLFLKKLFTYFLNGGMGDWIEPRTPWMLSTHCTTELYTLSPRLSFSCCFLNHASPLVNKSSVPSKSWSFSWGGQKCPWILGHHNNGQH